MSERELWFKAKKYGWGWTPANWKGWASLFLYIFILVTEFFDIDSNSYSASDTIFAFSIQALSFTALLIILCYLTGEKPRWRWGKD